MTELVLPKSWKKIKLREINDFKTIIISPNKFQEKFFELYSVPSFQINKPEFVLGKAIGSSKQEVLPDDILICKINPRINRVWKVYKNPKYHQIASSEWIVFRQKNIIHQFLLRYFQSSFFRDLLCSEVSGVGGSLTRAQPRRVNDYFIPIAPLSEQKVIADLLDQLIAQLDKLKLHLETILTTVKQFRQSVLNAAVTGKLTEDWRTKNSSFKEIKLLKDIIELAYGKALPSKTRSGEGFPVYGSNGIVGYHSEYLVEGPFIVIGRKGSFGEIVWSSKSGWPIDTSYYVISKTNDNLKFIYYLLQTLGLNQLNRSTAIPGLNRNDAYACKILIFSPEEQQEIVSRVENYFAFADKIEQQVKSAQERVYNLTPAILAKAFKGELTADWRAKHPELISGKNSAEALLKRIQAEQQTLTKPSKTKKQKII